MEKKEKDLYYLHELSGYKVDSDYSDVRGWEVKDKQNRTKPHNRESKWFAGKQTS